MRFALNLIKNLDADAVADEAREQGLLINAARPDTVRFMPALNVTADEIDLCLELLEQVIGKLLK